MKKMINDTLFKLLLLVVICILSADLLSGFQKNIFNFQFSMIGIGLAVWSYLYLKSQIMINNNLFISLLITYFFIEVLMIFLVHDLFKISKVEILFFNLPILYLLYFKVLLFFFKDNLKKNELTVIYGNRLGFASYNKSNKNSLTFRDKMFSILLFFGFMLLIVFIAKIINIQINR